MINLSLGDVGWPDSPASVLADQLALRGMAVCAAAGNEGEKGAFEVGAPSLGRHAISIASVDNTRMLPSHQGWRSDIGKPVILIRCPRLTWKTSIHNMVHQTFFLDERRNRRCFRYIFKGP